jgi:hypothetical protein
LLRQDALQQQISPAWMIFSNNQYRLDTFVLPKQIAATGITSTDDDSQQLQVLQSRRPIKLLIGVKKIHNSLRAETRLKPADNIANIRGYAVHHKMPFFPHINLICQRNQVQHFNSK